MIHIIVRMPFFHFTLVHNILSIFQSIIIKNADRENIRLLVILYQTTIQAYHANNITNVYVFPCNNIIGKIKINFINIQY